MIARLTWRDEAGRDAAVALPPEGSFVGRGKDCLVQRRDPRLARRHCRISFTHGQWLLEDVGGTSGTTLNDARVHRTALQHGDVIRCGGLELRFVLAEPGDPP